MVYFGLSQDETLKNYRLLGHGKGFILRTLIHLPSQKSVFHFIFSKDPPDSQQLLGGQGLELLQSIQCERGENLVYSFHFLCIISSSEASDAWGEKLICIMSFFSPPTSSEVWRPQWFMLSDSIFWGKCLQKLQSRLLCPRGNNVVTPAASRAAGSFWDSSFPPRESLTAFDSHRF